MTQALYREFDDPAKPRQHTVAAGSEADRVTIEVQPSTVGADVLAVQARGASQRASTESAPAYALEPSPNVRAARGFTYSGVKVNKSAKFWDKIAERYSKRPVADELSYQKKLEVTRKYFRPDMDVLEFGCGTGSTALAHAPHVKHIHAIDISSKMIEIAQRKADLANVENVTFEEATIDEFDVPDGTLDAVLGLSILHLLDDKEAVIAKVHKMLKPGGVFVTSTTCLGDTQKYLELILPIGKFLGFLPRVTLFTKKALEDSLAASGFQLDYRWQPGKGKAVFIVAKKSVQT